MHLVPIPRLHRPIDGIGLSGGTHNRVLQIRTEGVFHRNRSVHAPTVLSRDSRGRSLAKTVVYRVVAIALLAGISYYYTGNAGEAGLITILFNASGTIAYYGLERIWESVEWGRDRMGVSHGREGRGPVEPFLSSHGGVSPSPLKPDPDVNSAS
jgi:uncharacterized membrane protein